MRAFEDVYDRLFFTWLFGIAVLFPLSLIMMMGSATQNEYEIVRDLMAGVCAVWIIFFVGLLALVRGLMEFVYALNAVERYVGALVSRYKWKRKNSEPTPPLHINMNDFARGFNRVMPDTFHFDGDPTEEVIEQAAAQRLRGK
jgi:hypothetical protein